MRTCGHSSSFPAVVHRPLCSRCADARAIAAASHSYFLSLFTFGAVNAARRRFFQELARSHRHITGSSDRRRGGPSPGLPEELHGGVRLRPSPALRDHFCDDDGCRMCRAEHPVQHQPRCACTCDGDRVAPQPVCGYVKRCVASCAHLYGRLQLGVREGKA